MVIKEQGWWWRSYSLGGGVALFGRLNALLGCVWHANCHGFWRGRRAFERVGQECMKWRGEVTKVRFHFLLVTWPHIIISFFLSSNSSTVSCNQHTHFLLLLALLFQTLLFIFYSFFSPSFSLPFMCIQTFAFQNLLFIQKS